MKPHTRRAIAYIVGRLVSGKESTAVYDYDAAKHFSFSGAVAPGACSVYDYERECYIASPEGGGAEALFHHGNDKYVSLEIVGENFEGYDNDSERHFGGTVTEQSIALFDREDGRYHNYAI